MRRATLALALALAVSAVPAAAQDRARTWLGLGYGAGGARGGAEAAALMAELVHQKRAHHIAARGVVIVDPFGEGSDSFVELGLLYGRVAKGRTGHASLATGLALTSVGSCSAGAGCSTLGVPIVAEAAFRPVPVLGLGVQGFANLNKDKIFGGVVVFLQIGWMP